MIVFVSQTKLPDSSNPLSDIVGAVQSVINDRIQDLSHDAESLAMALSAIKTDDDTSCGVIVAVRSALLANSELATILSEQMDGLILLPELEATDHE